MSISTLSLLRANHANWHWPPLNDNLTFSCLFFLKCRLGFTWHHLPYSLHTINSTVRGFWKTATRLGPTSSAYGLCLFLWHCVLAWETRHCEKTPVPWIQSCSVGRGVCCWHGRSSPSLSVLTVTAWEECQGRARKDRGPVAVFSVRGFVADL